MKKLIKKLAEEQRALKSQRKTGTLPQPALDYFGYPIWSREQLEKLSSSWNAANKVQANKPRITAALNLYHELRGSDYRHGVDPDQRWAYDKAMKELREIFLERSDK